MVDPEDGWDRFRVAGGAGSPPVDAFTVLEENVMIEIRIHGRGGQGSVTAAELLAVAAFDDGREAQAFPAFGVERRGIYDEQR